MVHRGTLNHAHHVISSNWHKNYNFQNVEASLNSIKLFNIGISKRIILFSTFINGWAVFCSNIFLFFELCLIIFGQGCHFSFKKNKTFRSKQCSIYKIKIEKEIHRKCDSKNNKKKIDSKELTWKVNIIWHATVIILTLVTFRGSEFWKCWGDSVPTL